MRNASLATALLTLLFSFNSSANDKELLVSAKENFKPIPKALINVKKEASKISLGKKLYFEKKLSINNKISCNSCHMLDKFGVDNEVTSPGHDGTRGERNSPTVYNAAFHIAQFWDGRAKDLAAQAIGPILNPIEHGLKDEAGALKKIDTKEYRAMFKKAFPGSKEPFTYFNVGHAIAAFEKTLITPSRFDDFLAGKLNAITKTEKEGLNKFIETGCVACHDGVGIGGGQYQKLGAVNSYKTKDLGRFVVTKDEDDKHVFKVPTLRNIVHTGPYFHDGSIKTLNEAIKLMAKHQLDVDLKPKDVELIKAFLGSLTAKKLPTF